MEVWSALLSFYVRICLLTWFYITFWNVYGILGTVAASIADIDFVQRRKSIEQVLEDGTVSFLSISSLRYGFKTINTLTISAIARYLSVKFSGPTTLLMMHF